MVVLQGHIGIAGSVWSIKLKGISGCRNAQHIRAIFQELFDDCEGDMRKLMCHPKQHILAKLVHKMRVFRDGGTEWLFVTSSLIESTSQVMMKVVVMFLLMMMRMSWLKWNFGQFGFLVETS